MQESNATIAHFMADAHFGAAGEERERARVDRFVRYLAHVRERADELFIVGDLFDFWFEYTQVLPKTHIVIFTELASLVRSGVRVWYIAGNHDYWIGRFFEDSLGIQISHEPIPLRIQGRRLYVTHGDELTAGHDPGYRFLRRLMRNKLAIRAYHWIHPDVGIPFARWASHQSRGYTTRKKFALNRTLDRAVRGVFQKGYDGIIMGHVHFAEHFRYDPGECIILGDWIESFTYAEMTGGTITLKRWED